jgi:sulfur relay (sulfurtransferase) DsrC/TusE family protein
MEKKKFGAAAISFLQEYYGKHKKIPSTATLFKSFNKTKFYEVFPQGLAQACKAAGIPVPEERRALGRC